MKDKAKSQTNVLIVIFVILFFLILVLFLFNLIQPVNRTEYMNLYVNNMLQSIMNSDTGYLDRNCKLVSDAIVCAYTEISTYRCEITGPTCISLANETISSYLRRYKTFKNYRYLFVVKPEGVVTKYKGRDIELIFGNKEIEESKEEKFVGNMKIQKIIDGNPVVLNVKLIILPFSE